MAISEAWTDPDTLEKAVGEIYRAEDVNAVLGNLLYLYAGPRVTLARETSFDVDDTTDVTIEFSTALVDTHSGWDSDSPAVYVVQVEGDYLFTPRLLWPDVAGGTFRRWRLLKNGDPAGGGRSGATRFAEHADSIVTALDVGDSISMDVRHDAGSTVTVPSESSPIWRSPLLIGRWMGPKETSF